MFRSNWRGAEEWAAEGLPIKSTTSNEAIKLYDSALTQLVGWYDHPAQKNGLGGTLARMTEADPGFVLGQTLALAAELIGTGVSIRTDARLKQQLASLVAEADNRRPDLEWREWAHVQALDRFAHGQMARAAALWEDILLRHPTDMMALKAAHDTYFYLGEKAQIRDSVARVYPIWTASNRSSLPLREYIHGMYAFGLEETQFYGKAEQQAKLGLQAQPYDAWATHALAHVYEMATKPVEGLGFLGRTVEQWSKCNLLATHNYWHWALYHLELDEPEAAAELLENEVLRRAGGEGGGGSGSMLDLVDASSLLYRLELLHPGAGFTTPAQAQTVYRLVEPHLADHILGFNDAHFAMAALGVPGEDGKVETLLEGLRELKNAGNVVSDHWLEVTETLLQAMLDFAREKYGEALSKLTSIKYQLVKLGGSDAQRDVFTQLTAVAAIKAGAADHCRALLYERRALKGDDVLARRLAKATATTVDSK